MAGGRGRITVRRCGVAARARAANLPGLMNCLALSAALAATLALAPGVAAGKPQITSQDQLPRYSYDFKGKVTDVATKEEAYQQLAPKVRADLEKLLADYDIQDRATRQDVESVLLTMDLHEGATPPRSSASPRFARWSRNRRRN